MRQAMEPAFREPEHAIAELFRCVTSSELVIRTGRCPTSSKRDQVESNVNVEANYEAPLTPVSAGREKDWA